MERVTEIPKAAFIAHVNDVCGRVIVNTRYDVIDGVQKLILIYSDGSEKVFRGMRKVA